MSLILTKPGRSFDFFQSAKPAKPGRSGVSWLRSTDHQAFTYNKTLDQWLGYDTMATTFSSANATIALNDLLFWNQVQMGFNNGASWYTGFPFMIITVTANAINVPPSGSSIQYAINGGAFTDLLTWGGTTTFAEASSLSFLIGGNDLLSFRNNITGIILAAQRLNFVLYYKRRLIG